MSYIDVSPLRLCLINMLGAFQDIAFTGILKHGLSEELLRSVDAKRLRIQPPSDDLSCV